MRTASLLTALLLSLGQAPAAAEPPFLGPAPARNYQPIQLIFLNLPFESAAVTPLGNLRLEIESVESNVIATTQGTIESELKFETNRTVFGARLGVAERWELGFQVPLVSRFGGFLDPFIDEVEGLVGAGNHERDIYPNNSFGAFSVARGDTTLFAGPEKSLQLGDIALFGKREIHLGDAGPLLALRAAVELPTGNEDDVFGSGNPDIGVGLAADYRLLESLMLYLNLGLIYPFGRTGNDELSLEFLFTQSLAAEIALSERWSLLVHQALYTSPIKGTTVRLLTGTPVELGLGLNWTANEWLAFQALAINNVSPVEPAADFSVLLRSRIELPVGGY